MKGVPKGLIENSQVPRENSERLINHNFSSRESNGVYKNCNENVNFIAELLSQMYSSVN
jgi:hypothetical protein